MSCSCGTKLPATVSIQSFLPRALTRTVRAPARHRQRCLERASWEVDAVGRQLGDSVRHDRASEVDGLAARVPQWDICGVAGSANHAAKADVTGCRVH